MIYMLLSNRLFTYMLTVVMLFDESYQRWQGRPKFSIYSLYILP